MIKAPKIPLLYRAIAFTVALTIGLCTLQFYVFGAKFAGAVTNYARLSVKQAAEEEAKAKKFAADQQRFKEPGVVGVQIIATPPKKDEQKP